MITPGAKLLAGFATLLGALIVVLVLVASCGGHHRRAERIQTACTAQGLWDSGANVYLRRPPLCPSGAGP